MPELAIGPFTEFGHDNPVRSAWRPELTSGGPGGGAAVAVTRGMAAVAVGSDDGGSLRCYPPAAALSESSERGAGAARGWTEHPSRHLCDRSWGRRRRLPHRHHEPGAHPAAAPDPARHAHAAGTR